MLHLDADLAQKLVSGVTVEANGESPAVLSERRDALIAIMQKAMAPLRVR